MLGLGFQTCIIFELLDNFFEPELREKDREGVTRLCGTGGAYEILTEDSARGTNNNVGTVILQYLLVLGNSQSSEKHTNLN